MSERKGFKDMFEKAKESQAYWNMKLELKQDELDKLTASLAEAREQTDKAVKMMSEQEYGYNKKTNDMIYRHSQQCSALREQLSATQAENERLSEGLSNRCDEVARLLAELAKYEGAVELNLDVCVGSQGDSFVFLPDEFVDQPVTVWVKRRTE